MLKSFVKILLMLFIVFIGIVTLGCGGLVGLEKEKNPVLTTTTIEGANSVMTIGVPYQLQDIPNKNLEVYKQGNGRNSIEIICFSFDENKLNEDFDYDTYIKGILGKNGKKNKQNELQMRKIKNIGIGNISVDGISGKKFVAQSTDLRHIKSGPIKYISTDIEGYVFMKDHDLWTVIIYDLTGDNIAKEISEQMIKSIKIK